VVLEPADREESIAVATATDTFQWQVVRTVDAAVLVQAWPTGGMRTAGDLEELDVFLITDETFSHICVFRMGLEDQVLRLLKFAVCRSDSDHRWIVSFVEHDGSISVELLEALNPTIIHSQPKLSYRVEVDVAPLLRHVYLSPLTYDRIFRDKLIDLRFDSLHRCPPIACNENKESFLCIP